MASTMTTSYSGFSHTQSSGSSYNTYYHAIASPPLRPLNSPYTRIPLPETMDRTASTSSGATTSRLNTLLAPGPNVRFDLASGPEQITIQPPYPFPSSSSPHALHDSSLSEPAVYPPLSSLTITSKHLPWPIIVRPHSGVGYVTVGDVFGTLYVELRRRVSRGELMSVHASREQRLVIETAELREGVFLSMVSAQSGKRTNKLMAVNVDGSVRRVDMFYGARRFMGLSEKGRGEWELLVSYF